MLSAPGLLVGPDAARAEDGVGLVDDGDHPAAQGLGRDPLPPDVTTGAERPEGPVADRQDGGEVGVDDVTRAQLAHGPEPNEWSTAERERVVGQARWR